MNELYPRLVARVTDVYENVRNPHACADALHRALRMHSPVPVWRYPDLWDEECRRTCDRSSHPHGEAIDYVCSSCLVLADDADGAFYETYPCTEIELIGMGLGLCEEVEVEVEEGDDDG